jgi:hypothetical protein
MSIGGRSGGGVSEQVAEARDRTRPMRRENGLRHNFPDRVTERTDGTGGSVDAVMGAAIDPYRKSSTSRARDGRLLGGPRGSS